MSNTTLEQLLSSRFGLAPRDGWSSEVRRLVREVAGGHGFDDAEASMRAVERREDLLRSVAERLTVRESYFYRHLEELEVAVRHIVACVGEASRRTVSVWSAGCARGEEPYTIAMLLERRLPAELLGKVRIVGTDLHGDAIVQAREGVYGAWSLRAVPAVLRGQDFDEVAGGYRIAPRFRERVQYVHASLLDHVASFPDQSLDVVLFRNVGIYLTSEALSRFFAGVERVLAPGGLLVLSATDPTPVGTRLARAPELGTSVYRRIDGSIATASPVRSAPLPYESSRLAVRLPSPARGETALLKDASDFADRGRYDDALGLLDGFLRRHAESSAGWYLRGQIHFARARYDAALADFERAERLDPSGPEPRLFAAMSLRKLGRIRCAVAVLQSLEADLAAEPTLPSARSPGSVRQREMLDVVRFELASLR